MKAWGIMGGQIDWAAIPLISETIGIIDIEKFINQLVIIREFQRENHD